MLVSDSSGWGLGARIRELDDARVSAVEPMYITHVRPFSLRWTHMSRISFAGQRTCRAELSWNWSTFFTGDFGLGLALRELCGAVRWG